MLKNLTVTVEEEAIRWARIRAAEENTSLSRLVGKLLEREMHGGKSRGDAFERWKKLEQERSQLVLLPAKRMTREEANERHPEWSDPRGQ